MSGTDRGVSNSGMSIAQDLVTDFCDNQKALISMLSSRSTARWVAARGWDKLIAGRTPGSQKNIVWRDATDQNNGAVVIKEKIYLMYEDGWKADAPMLLCLDAHTGKTLWEKPVDYLDALSVEEQATAKKARALEHERYRRMTLWNELHWNNDENRQRTKEERASIWPAFQRKPMRRATYLKRLIYRADTAWRARFGIKLGQPGDKGGYPKDKALIDNYETVKKNRWLVRQHWTTEKPWYGGVHASVLSDGEALYAVTGQSALAKYDLDGNQLWLQWMKPAEDKGGRGIQRIFQRRCWWTARSSTCTTISAACSPSI